MIWKINLEVMFRLMYLEIWNSKENTKLSLLSNLSSVQVTTYVWIVIKLFLFNKGFLNAFKRKDMFQGISILLSWVTTLNTDH